MKEEHFIKWLPVYNSQLKEGDYIRYSGAQLGFPDRIYKVRSAYKDGSSVYEDSLGIRDDRGFEIRNGVKVIKGAYLKMGYNIFPNDYQKMEQFVCKKIDRDTSIGSTVWKEKGGFGKIHSFQDDTKKVVYVVFEDVYYEEDSNQFSTVRASKLAEVIEPFNEDNKPEPQ